MPRKLGNKKRALPFDFGLFYRPIHYCISIVCVFFPMLVTTMSTTPFYLSTTLPLFLLSGLASPKKPSLFCCCVCLFSPKKVHLFFPSRKHTRFWVSKFPPILPTWSFAATEIVKRKTGSDGSIAGGLGS